MKHQKHTHESRSGCPCGGGGHSQAGRPEEAAPAREGAEGEESTLAEGASRRGFLLGAGAVALGAVAAGCAKKKSGDGALTGQRGGAGGGGGAPEAMAGMEPARRPGERPVARPAERPFEVPSSVAGRGAVFGAEHGGMKGADGMPARVPVEKMLDHLMAELTGKSKPLDAWATLFRPDDVVAVKPNTLGRDWCSPSPVLVTLIIERLRAVGVKAENIYVWDRPHFDGTKLLAALQAGAAAKGGPLTGIHVGLQDAFGYDPREVKISTGQTEKLTNVIHRATAVVNVPVWKDHGKAGVTGAVKNIGFGMMKMARAFHPNACTPAVVDFYNLPMVRPKIRLTLADVHRAVYEGGPRASAAHNVWLSQMYATRDPVALDRLQWHALDGMRKSKGLPLLMDRHDKGKTDGTPIHVEYGASKGLGEAAYDKIKLTMKKLG